MPALASAPLRPLSGRFTFAELTPLLRRLNPALYIGEIGLYNNVMAVDPAILPQHKRVIVGAGQKGDESLPWEELLEGARSDVPLRSAVANKPAALITTSGTTGEPKFVVDTPATLAESTNLLIQGWELSSEDIIAAPLPLAHMSGLITFRSYMQIGTAFVLLESFDADTVLDTIERHRCSVHVGFPAQYAALLDSYRSRSRNLGALRLYLTGGECLSDRSAAASYRRLRRSALQYLGCNRSHRHSHFRSTTRASHPDHEGRASQAD